MRRRLWRDPYPPRKLRADYPPWLQEIVLRCLEIEPVWRYPTASQLAFELAHPDQVKLTARAERLNRDPITTVWRRRFNGNLTQPRGKADVAAQLASGPIVAIALDIAEGSRELNEALRVTAERILATLPSARLACLNVLKLGRVTIDRTLDEEGNNKHVDRLVALRHWASPLKLDENRLTVHVLEAVDPAAAILEFAEANHVDHIVIGARQNSLRRTLLGSVSAKVAAEAACTVTVVRPPRLASLQEQERRDETPVGDKADGANPLPACSPSRGAVHCATFPGHVEDAAEGLMRSSWHRQSSHWRRSCRPALVEGVEQAAYRHGEPRAHRN